MLFSGVKSGVFAKRIRKTFCTATMGEQIRLHKLGSLDQSKARLTVDIVPQLIRLGIFEKPFKSFINAKTLSRLIEYWSVLIQSSFQKFSCLENLRIYSSLFSKSITKLLFKYFERHKGFIMKMPLN